MEVAGVGEGFREEVWGLGLYSWELWELWGCETREREKEREKERECIMGEWNSPCAMRCDAGGVW